MARNPAAVAKALLNANVRNGGDPATGGFGSVPSVVPAGQPSPLVQSYGAWTTGQNLTRSALPRDPATFLAGSFGPLSPMLPVPIDAPDPDTGRPDPRRWQYPVSWNMPNGVPGSEGLKLASFANLRVIGQTYSVARACIQLRKSELLGLGWDVVPTKAAEKAMRTDLGARKEFDKRRDAMRKFWRRPDQQYFSFRDWFSVLLEDVLVIDALSIYLWPARSKGKGVLGSDLGQLAAIDGSTIRPLVDVHGATPMPPNPGYQQYLFGVPRTDLVTMQGDQDIAGFQDSPDRQYGADQLIYRPNNPQVWTPYGLSNIEQALIPIMSGLQRQQFQLDFFSEGTIPGLFISAGDENATPQQLRQLQDALNAMAGDPAWKHKIIVLPKGSRTDPQRPAELAGQFDEVVMSQVCMAFGVMPMELGVSPRMSSTQSSGAANQMAKASGDIQDRKANKPLLEWFADIFNHVIQDVCGQQDMQWWWEGLEQDEDEQTQTAIEKDRVSVGLMSIDEARIKNGDQPWGLPMTSEPVLITPTGVIPFGSIDPTTGQPAGLTAKLTAVPPPPGQLPPGGQPPKDGGAPAKPAGGPKPPTPPSGGKTPAQQPKPAPTPAHAAAQSTTAAQKPAAPTKPAQPAAKPATKAARVDAFAALRELDLIRRRLTKGRPIGNWTPEHLPADVFTALTQDGDVDRARTAVKAMGAAQRRADTITPAQQRIVDGLRRLTAGLANGTTSTLTFVDEGVGLLRAAIRECLTHGTHAAADTTTVKLSDEFEAWRAAFDARFQQYATVAQTAYDEGHALATLSSGGDWLIRWDARPGACDLCSARDGNLYQPGDLPGLPGMGGYGTLATVCRGGPQCRCGITYLRRGDTRPAAAFPASPSGGHPAVEDRVADFRQDMQANLAAAREARQAGHTSPTDGPYADLLDTIADQRAEHQRPYLTGLMQGILTAHTRADGRSEPDTADVYRPAGGDQGGHFGGIVAGTVITAGTAALIAEQVHSQQQAAPATGDAQPEPATATKHDGHADMTHEVYAYLARHYPANTLEWVKDAHWHPPVQVKLSDIEMGRRPGGRDPDKVAQIAHSIEDGHPLQPIVLVRTPDGLPFRIADGYHRTLALVHAGRRTVQAWIGDVDTDDGPWNREMHDEKLNKVYEGPVGDYRARALHRYWTRGEGLGVWAGSPHPWRALRDHLAEHIHDPDELDRTTSQWFHDALGIWPGEREGKNPVGPG